MENPVASTGFFIGRRTDPLNEPALQTLHSILLNFSGIKERLDKLHVFSTILFILNELKRPQNRYTTILLNLVRVKEIMPINHSCARLNILSKASQWLQCQ